MFSASPWISAGRKRTMAWRSNTWTRAEVGTMTRRQLLLGTVISILWAGRAHALSTETQLTPKDLKANGLYVSPVGFSSSLVPEQWRLLYSLNPMVGVIDGFRWCLLDGSPALHWPSFAISVALIAAVLAGGISFFRRTERSFADVI